MVWMSWRCVYQCMDFTSALLHSRNSVLTPQLNTFLLILHIASQIPSMTMQVVAPNRYCLGSYLGSEVNKAPVKLQP